VTEKAITRLITAACAFGLVALGLMAWSVIVPRPLPVMLAMSLGQLLGTLSFGAYLVAIVLDLRRARILARKAPPSAETPGPP
jgi:hypothetical protein